MKSHSLSAAGLCSTHSAVELIREARARRQDGRPSALLVPSKVDRRTAASAAIEAVLHEYGEPGARGLAQRIAHADAISAGRWIRGYAPGCAANPLLKALAGVKRLAEKERR